MMFFNQLVRALSIFISLPGAKKIALPRAGKGDLIKDDQGADQGWGSGATIQSRLLSSLNLRVESS